MATPTTTPASDPTHANETLALVVGLVGFAVIVLINVAATVFSLRHRRRAQRLTGHVVDPFERLLSRWLTSRQRYTRADISPCHRVNGYPPPDPAYQRLAEQDFAGYRPEVSGLGERPLSLALSDLRELASTSQITKHNCIQGVDEHRRMGRRPARRDPRSMPPRVSHRVVGGEALNHGPWAM